MAIQVTIDMAAKEGRFDDLREWFVKNLPGTRSFAGNISVEVARNQDEPARILFVEKWDSRADFEAYLAWRDESGVIAELLEMLDGEITFRYHDFLGV
ncbi:antibiotic biosynthesis monooxygenase [Nocardia neocaledoniensis NBRC 108232]|uniref:Quinol monooxygenase YgiN n=1 Tax=Nocardia neocaledoniensis TaxID=236511 RepID=A0A317N2W6_9NOCA|nr:antibiotic biosynthesis monooxygenase family protein [Nocardia neocaledoniensis]PWV68939.1 quinol monooxygenase YgiN [Nocardia neocaledoniensis]GEM29579.1 antibiotic biosynthesis monooxygenase [Nocardia neocaledoniensis NBRC 108232]